MENSLINSFSNKQKLSAITLMRAIMGGTQDANKAKLQDGQIIKQAIHLGISIVECDNFANNLNIESLKRELISLNNAQKDFIVGMTMELLHTGGEPTDRDIMITENIFEKLANINPDELDARAVKIAAIGNYLYK